MPDVKLTYNPDTREFDINFVNGDIEPDHGLETAVVISLFTNKRVGDDELPKNEQDRAGWWADETLPGNDQIGSLLWVIAKKTITENVITKAQEYCVEALRWMIVDGVAKSVDVIVTREGINSIWIGVSITKPDNVVYKYKMLWNSMR